MFKYVLTAAVLKAFSLNDFTKWAYRKTGNVLGQRKRKKQNINEYVKRGNLLVSLCRQYGVLKKGCHLLELGTGWIHWYGLFVRLHSDVFIDLFDVWDNRQFDALKKAFHDLEQTWHDGLSVSPKAVERLSSVTHANSFDEIYKKFGINYRINENGALGAYPDSYFDCVFSFHVLEHVGREVIENTIKHIYRTLKPGGYSIHQIGIDDHLSHYDKKESAKNYVRYSHRAWKRYFDNAVQYHNRLQVADFLNIFSINGFEGVETNRDICSLGGLRVHPDWQNYSVEDLQTTTLTIVHKKT